MSSIGDGRPAQCPVEFPLHFLIIGAQKAGTSWLHDRLRRVPGLWLPPDKDFEYFSYPGAASSPEFASRFEAAPEGALVGDACASYFWTTGHSARNPGFAEDPPAVIDAAVGPGARYIVLLRDPVERALSGYLHHVAFGSLDPGVALLDAPEELGLIEIGCYGRHLEAWSRRVGVERLFVRPAPGEIEPARLLSEVCEFLGVRPPAGETGEAVFPGLRRWRDEDGLWVAVGQPGVDKPVGPVREFGGQPATLLIDAATIRAVTDRLRPDTEHLAEQLEGRGQSNPAYRLWPTWPAGV